MIKLQCSGLMVAGDPGNLSLASIKFVLYFLKVFTSIALSSIPFNDTLVPMPMKQIPRAEL